MKAEAVLKIFIAPRNSLCELTEEARIESKWDVFTHKDSSEECAKVFTLFAWACLAYKPYFFSQRTVFFSHTKSVNGTFSHDLSVKQAQVNRTFNP